jgi:hypothetical protein
MKREVLEKLSELMTAAFGLVAALAWNDAIKSLFMEGGPLYFVTPHGIWIYALLVTVIAVFATIWIGRVIERTGVTKTN